MNPHPSMEDAKSAKVVKDALDHFCNMSGLKPNMTLPVSYLGVPLVSKLVGRLQLITFVLSVIHVYWESVFIIPKTVIKDIDKILKGFLWNQGEMKNVKAKVSWKVVNVIRLKGKSIWCIDIDPNASAGWKQILPLRGLIGDIIPIDEIKKSQFDLNIKVHEMIDNGEWNWLAEWRNKFPTMADIPVPSLKPNTPDSTSRMTKKGFKIRISLAASVHFIWSERNKRLFANEEKDWETVLKTVIIIIRFKLSSVKIKSSTQVNRIEEIWNVKMNIQRSKEIILEDRLN
ncbi:hypothetical protein Tco_1400707 [Tanacetum coccineum]